MDDGFSTPVEQLQPPVQGYSEMPSMPAAPVAPPQPVPLPTKAVPKMTEITDIFDKSAQYDIAYIAGAGLLINSDYIQGMMREYIPSLFADGSLTTTGVLVQFAVVGVLFVLLRHFMSKS